VTGGGQFLELRRLDFFDHVLPEYPKLAAKIYDNMPQEIKQHVSVKQFSLV
jgi:hypothetical protein